MGYLFIVAGLVLLVSGIIMVVKPTPSTVVIYKEPNPEKHLSVKTQTASPLPEKSEVIREVKVASAHTEQTAKPAEAKNETDENKAKGDAFEKFVVKKFNPQYFTLQEWRSDKYVDGTYAVSNHYPDLEVHFELKSKGIKDVFAVECKWRRNYFKDGIEWANDYQIANYKKYAAKLNIPVFVVIGVGGEPEQPEDLYIVPLNKLQSNTVSRAHLLAYKKDEAHSGLFWDSEDKMLK